MNLINQLGGGRDVLGLILIIALACIINSFIQHKKARCISAVLFSLFIVAQVFSLYFTQSFIGYQFYVHANLRGTIDMGNLFGGHIFVGMLCFLIIFALSYQAENILKKLFLPHKPFKYSKTLKILFIGLLLFGIGYGTNFMSDSQTLLPLLQDNSSEDFKTTLRKYNMSDYVTPDKIKSTAGKNVIVISMESIEKAFLNAPYNSLTPNINRLKNRWNYFDVEQNKGSSWTSGSLYTYMTGFPAFFGARGNKIFQTVYDSNISGITHALSKANYSTCFLSGNADFSGTKEMLNVLDIEEIIDFRNTPTTGNESYYGLRDKDLFQIAKTKLNTLKKSEKPFALFISTVDTHFPNGIYDKRMETIISPKNTELEFMVAALDYLIGDFVSYLEKEGILDNTTIYLFPDHLKMGDPSMFTNSGKRGLYCITNSDQVMYDSMIFQIDLPKIILKGANVTHNLKFLTDYIVGNKEEYIKNNIMPITEINTSGILNSNIGVFDADQISKRYEEYKKDTLRFIAHAGGEIDEKRYTNSLEALNLSYKKGFKMYELDILKTKDNYFVAAHDWKGWAKKTGYTGELPPTRSEFLSKKILGKYTPMDMETINKWFSKHQDAILVTDKVNSPLEVSNLFVDKNRLIMELFDHKALQEALECNILSAMPNQILIENISKSDIRKLAKQGVQHIAISRHFISKNKELLGEFNRNGIKPYVYHVNMDRQGIDEDYVIKYEMDYIYGIYADEWSF